MDDDSFKVRVEKIFGSLAPSSSTWSVSDDAVDRREWIRDKDTSARDETPCSSSFNELLRKGHRRQRSFRLDADADAGAGSDDERSRDEWEIRSSIGLDPTLDNEEEEDEFDKVALGRENAGERLYMNDVTGRGPYMNLQNIVPNPLNGATKDPRANCNAARIRLKEDEAEAQNLSFPHSACDTELKESHAQASTDSGPHKSILKRKGNSKDSKPQKRVRFDPGCKIDCVVESERVQCSSVNTPSMDATDSNYRSQPSQNVCKLPDYLVNPSKYTHYSFDSSDDYNEESSIKSCMDVLRLVKDLKAKDVGSGVENASGDLPISLTFIPRKKMVDVKVENSSSEIKENKVDYGKVSLSRVGFPVGIAVAESQHSEVSAEEEIEPETNAADEGVRFQNPCRKYRTPSRSDDSD